MSKYSETFFTYMLPNDAHFASCNIFKDGNDVIYLIERTEKILTLISNSIVIQMKIIAKSIDRKLRSDAIAARHTHTQRYAENALFAKKMVFDPSFNWSYIIEFEMRCG